ATKIKLQRGAGPPRQRVAGRILEHLVAEPALHLDGHDLVALHGHSPCPIVGMRCRHHRMVRLRPSANSTFGAQPRTLLARPIDRTETGTSVGRPAFHSLAGVAPSSASTAAMTSRTLRPRPLPMLKMRSVETSTAAACNASTTSSMKT